MLVQPMAKQFSYNNCQFKPQNTAPMFKGEFGMKVLKEIESSGKITKESISEVLSKLGIGTMGLVAISKLKDILEAVFKKKTELENTKTDTINVLLNEKKDLQNEKKDLEDKLIAQKRTYEDDKKKQDEKMDTREAELNQKEQTLMNVEKLLKQGEIDVIKSNIRAFYGIKDPEIKTYDGLGEQCIAIIDIINQNRKNQDGHVGVEVSNYNDTNLNKLVLTLQNNDKKINSDTLEVIKKITAMHDYDLSSLIDAVKILKDENGNMDFNKTTYFIALYSLDNTDLNSVRKNTAKAFNIEDGFRANDNDLRATTDSLRENINNHSRLYKYAKMLNSFNLSNNSYSAIIVSRERARNVMEAMNRNCCNDSREAYKQLTEFLWKCDKY